jgi:hypothetical protein
MAIPALLRISAASGRPGDAVTELERQIQSRIEAAAAAKYQVMSLFEIGAGKSEKSPTGARQTLSQEREEEPASKEQ